MSSASVDLKGSTKATQNRDDAKRLNVMTTTNRRETASKKLEAKRLVQAGQHSRAQIARDLAVSENTLNSWARRYGWEAMDAAGRVKSAIVDKLESLIANDDGSLASAAQIERYMGYVERVERIRQQPIEAMPLPEDSPIPSPSPARGEGGKKQRGRPKSSEKNVIDADMTQALVEEFERVCFAYQREWWDARIHDGRVILKSRQIGATFYFALEALIIAITTGKNQIFVSASKKQAAQFRRNIVRFVKRVCDLDLQGDPMRLILPDHPAGEVFLFFLGTQVSSVQGYSGDLYLDECAWVRKFADIQEVASAMALQAVYRETYFTTPSTMDHDFYKFWNGTTYNKDRPKEDQISIDTSHDNLKDGKMCGDGYWRQIVTLYDAIAKGCNLFNLEKVKRKYSPARFAMLCMCLFTDHTASVFSFRQLHGALVEVAEKWADFDPLSARPLGDLRCWLGYDPSGEGDDAAALVVIVPPCPSYPKYRVVEVIRMDDADYQQQFEQIQLLREKYNIEYIGIDNQGEGAGVYQQVLKVFPTAEALRYSPESKGAMVIKLQTLLKRKHIEIDNVYLDEVLPALLAIQRSSTKEGTPTYTAQRNNDVGHADVAWALLHAVHHAEFETLISAAEDGGVGNESLIAFF
jgi:uncharacterized protein YjcR